MAAYDKQFLDTTGLTALWAKIKDTFSLKTHGHGSITSDGKIGSTANLPVITGTSGALTTGTFATSTVAVATSSAAGTANTFSRGDHMHSISLATGDSAGQVKIAGSNVSVNGWANKADTSLSNITTTAFRYMIPNMYGYGYFTNIATGYALLATIDTTSMGENVDVHVIFRIQYLQDAGDAFLGDQKLCLDCRHGTGTTYSYNAHLLSYYSNSGNVTIKVYRTDNDNMRVYGVITSGSSKYQSVICRVESCTGWTAENSLSRITLNKGGSSSTAPTGTEITVTAVTPFAASSHAHGNITSSGTLTATGAAIENTDTLLFVDKTDNKIKQTTIAFDGSTTTTMLSKKGTWSDTIAYSNTAKSLQHQNSNEINIKSIAESTAIAANEWFNYRNGDTNALDPDHLITDYKFGNRNGTTDVTLHASYINAISDRAYTAYTNGSAKVTDDTRWMYVCRLKGITSNTYSTVSIMFNNSFWNTQHANVFILNFVYGRNGGQGTTVSVSCNRNMLLQKNSDLEFKFLRNPSDTIADNTIDVYFKVSATGNAYGAWYAKVLNSDTHRISNLIEWKWLANQTLPEGAEDIPLGIVATSSNYGHVKLDNSTPLTVGTTSTDGVATGKAHIHNALEAVNRVTDIDLAHSYTNNHGHVRLDIVGSQMTGAHDPGDGYVLSCMWDNSGAYDAQLFIPDSGTSTVDFGRLKIRYRNNNAWGDWGYLVTASQNSLINSSTNIDTLYGSNIPGQVLGYYWDGDSQPTGSLPSSTSGDTMLFVYTTANSADYVMQVSYRAGTGIYQRRRTGGTWGAWEKVLVSSDIATGSSSGTISVAGTNVAVNGWSNKEDRILSFISASAVGYYKFANITFTNINSVYAGAILKVVCRSFEALISVSFSEYTSGNELGPILGNVYLLNTRSYSQIANYDFYVLRTASMTYDLYLHLKDTTGKCCVSLVIASNCSYTAYDSPTKVDSLPTSIASLVLPYHKKVYAAANANTVGSTSVPVYADANGELKECTIDSTPTASSTNLVTSGGVKSALDAKTDIKVKATASTTNGEYKVLATASTSPTSGNATEAVYGTGITINPSNSTISGNRLVGALNNGSKSLLNMTSQSSTTKFMILGTLSYTGYKTTSSGTDYAAAYYNAATTLTIQSRHSGSGTCVMSCQVNGQWGEANLVAGGTAETAFTGNIYTYSTNKSERISYPIRMYRKYTAPESGSFNPKWTVTVVVPYLDYNDFKIINILQNNGLTLKTSEEYFEASSASAADAELAAEYGTLIASGITPSYSGHTHAASAITSGTLPVARGGTGITTSTNKNAVVIGNSTTVTDAMQTVRTGNGAFYATAQDAKPTFGTLPVAQGGTGKTTAKAAQNNLLSDMNEADTAVADSQKIVFKYVSSGSDDNGAVYCKPAPRLRDYINSVTKVTDANAAIPPTTNLTAGTGEVASFFMGTSATNSPDSSYNFHVYANIYRLDDGTKYRVTQMAMASASTPASIAYERSGRSNDSGATWTWSAWKQCLFSSDVVSTYSATGTAPVNGTAVASAISGKANAATNLTAATKCKITYNAQGIVTAGADLAAGDIPNLAASKITSGTFGTNRIADDAITAAKVKDNETLPVSISGTATTATNANNAKVTKDTANPIYLAGVKDDPGTSGANKPLYTDTGIFATSTAGQLQATSYKVTANATIQYNSTDQSLDFVFA